MPRTRDGWRQSEEDTDRRPAAINAIAARLRRTERKDYQKLADEDSFVKGVAAAAARAHQLLDEAHGSHTHTLDAGVRKAARLMSSSMMRRLCR